MSHDEIAGTLSEIMQYFGVCLANAAHGSQAGGKFTRYMEALSAARMDELSLKWQEDDRK